MFRIEQGESLYGLKPMNCPGHMLLFGSQLRSYRDLPIRYAEAPSLHRDEPTGSAARAHARPARHPGRRPHLLHGGSDRGGDRRMFDYVDFLYDLFGVRELAHAELSTRPDNKLGTDEEWDFTEGVLRRALERSGIATASRRATARSTGRRSTSSWTTCSAARGRWGRFSSTGSMPQRFGLTYMGADNREHTPYVIHRALFGSLERFIGILHRALRRRIPVLARAGAGARPAGRGGASRGGTEPRAGGLASRLPRRRGRADRDDRQADPRRRAREDPVHGRLRRPREETGSLAMRERGGEQSTLSMEDLLEYSTGLLRLTPEKQGRTRSSPPGPRAGPRGFNRVEVLTRKRAAACSGFSVATTKRGGVSPTW